MQRNENHSPLRICYFRTVIERGSFVCLARQDDSETLRFKRNSQQASEAQDDIAFGDVGRSARTLIGAAVRRVENDHSQRISRRGGLLHGLLRGLLRDLRRRCTGRCWRRLLRRSES